MDPKFVPNSFFTHSFLDFKVSYVQFLLLHTYCAGIVDFQKVAKTTHKNRYISLHLLPKSATGWVCFFTQCIKSLNIHSDT